MNTFISSILLCIVAFIAAFGWGGWDAVMICALLTLMEVSFSFDNAVVNAVVLKDMDELWQKRFLTWGMLIAVGGMRLVFPIMIVAFATGLSTVDVVNLALHQPEEYSRHVMESHVQIGAFGSMFLLMVFLNFIFDETKEVHWIHMLESKLVRLGKMEAIEIVIALMVLVVAQGFLPEAERIHAMTAGIIGIILYVLVSGLTALMDGGAHQGATHTVASSGLMGFIYLQFLDASFSLDGVIGAFAMSNDIIIIMLGLGVGAMFVRSLTIYLVKKGTLDTYQFLEHGAHYGIGVLALIMLISMVHPVPEIITGMVGAVFIGLSLWSSIRRNRL